MRLFNPISTGGPSRPAGLLFVYFLWSHNRYGIILPWLFRTFTPNNIAQKKFQKIWWRHRLWHAQKYLSCKKSHTGGGLVGPRQKNSDYLWSPTAIVTKLGITILGLNTNKMTSLEIRWRHRCLVYMMTSAKISKSLNGYKIGLERAFSVLFSFISVKLKELIENSNKQIIFADFFRFSQKIGKKSDFLKKSDKIHKKSIKTRNFDFFSYFNRKTIQNKRKYRKQNEKSFI